MQTIEKKKRARSGSRSKSRKYKNGELSVDIKARQMGAQPEPKNTTEHSSSVNKSKPSRKTSLKQQKKHTKSSNKDPKDPASHSVSAQRKHSLTKMNKTEVNYENEEVEKQTFKVLRNLKRLQLPACTNVQLLQKYYDDIRDCFQGADDSLYHFCMELHSYYMTPLKPLFEMLLPYEDYLQKKDEIGRQIDQQIYQNEKLWEQLSPVDVEIFKLKEKIEENKSLIQKKRLIKQQRDKQLQERSKASQPKSFPSKQPQGKEVKPERIEHIGKGFKLDLQHINKQPQLGFHEEFYAKIDEFSESWRNQALREKRF